MVNKEVLHLLIGKKIASLRDLQNLSQTALAKKVNVNRATISNIEAGRQNISVFILFRIAEVFETEISIIAPTFQEINGYILQGRERIEKILDEKNASASLRDAILNVGKPSKDDK